MMRRVAFLCAGALIAATTAHALVLTEKSPEQKFRRDVGKQLTKYTLCIVKAAQACEKNGTSTAVECHLDTGVVDGGIDPKGKFGPALQKCADKVALAKKSPSGGTDPVGDYQGIGCPGDSNAGTAGDQPFADLTAYQAGSEANSRAQIAGLALLIDTFGCAAGTGNTDEADIACVQSNAEKLGALAKGVFKCGDKCENDYKAKAGNGGTTDSPNCAQGGDATNQLCLDAALAKATKKGPFDAGVLSGVLPAVQAALTTAGNDLYNQNDCP
jgi:hypothetical protein